jgi:hypothetical protein
LVLNQFSDPNIAKVVYVHTSHLLKWKKTWLMFFQSCSWVLILESLSKRLLLSKLSNPDVNTCWKLSALSCDKKFVEINNIPVNTTSAEIQGV